MLKASTYIPKHQPCLQNYQNDMEIIIYQYRFGIYLIRFTITHEPGKPLGVWYEWINLDLAWRPGIYLQIVKRKPIQKASSYG